MKITAELPSKELIELVLNKKDVLVITWANRYTISYAFGYIKVCNISVNDFIDKCQEYFFDKYNMNLILSKFKTTGCLHEYRSRNKFIDSQNLECYYGYKCSNQLSYDGRYDTIGETKLEAMLKMCHEELERINKES